MHKDTSCTQPTPGSALQPAFLQLGGQLLRIHQQQAQQHQQQAKIATAAATQRAKQDLQLMKEEQERKKLHAAELRAQLGKHRMVT